MALPEAFFEQKCQGEGEGEDDLGGGRKSKTIFHGARLGSIGVKCGRETCFELG